MTGIDTASWISRILSGSAMRATPPSRRMSAGTRSSAMTAQAPASSAMRACSAVVTSMITPPLSISASPLFTRIVPISAIAPILARGPCLAQTAAHRVGLRGRRLGVPVDDGVALEVEERAQAAPLELVRGGAPVARDEDVRVVLRVPEGDREDLAVARRAERPGRRAARDEVERRRVDDDVQAALAQARGGRLQRVVARRPRL